MTLLQSGIAKPSSGYTIDQSLRFDDGDSAYFNRTAGTATSNDIGTFSFWTKRGNLGGGNSFFSNHSDANNRTYIGFDADTITMFGKISGSANVELLTTPVFRDPSAWYHIVIAVDVTQSTASNRVKIYVNGSQVTDFSTSTYPAQNTDLPLFSKTNMQVGAFFSSSIGDYYDGYLAEYYYIDGQQLAPASFGETNSDTNQWQAIEYAGSYGTNGFYLKFQDSSALGDDSSGNTNDFTVNNLVAADQVLDSPANNFATLNPLDPAANQTLSEGNLKQVTSGQGISKGTIQIPSSGKWYWEVCQTDTDQLVIGIAKPTATLSNYLGSDANGWGYGGFDGSLYNNGGGSSYGNTYTNGDIVGVAFDADNQAVYFSKNNTWQNSGDPTSGSSKTGAAVSSLTDEYSPASGSQNSSGVYNFGQDSSFAGNKTAQGNGGVGEDFYYAPPTGFKAINTSNFDDPSIADPTKHFNTKLWTSTSADGTSALGAVTGVGFQPDLVWAKGRTDAWDHSLFNSVMGTGLGKALYTDVTFEAGAYDTSGYGNVTSFDSDGFTVGLTAGLNYAYNYGSGGKYVAWNWKAGGTASSNSDGAITSSVSANPTAGFSIVSWTASGTNNDTVGHGLSVVPELIIMKSIDGARANVRGWEIYTQKIDGSLDFLNFNTNPKQDSSANVPTSSVFSVIGSVVNSSGENIIGYCFHSVDGYSKVGTYTGNSNANGTFVYTGFRPAWLLIKKYDGAENWIILDNKRDSYNVVRKGLYADLSNFEGASDKMDFTSNGFKIKSTTGVINSSANFLYLAFAESPFKYSNAR